MTKFKALIDREIQSAAETRQRRQALMRELDPPEPWWLVALRVSGLVLAVALLVVLVMLNLTAGTH